MFYTIKHLPTKTWVPMMPSQKHRLYYFSFLEGETVNGSPYNKKTLNFHEAFKYKNKEQAQKTVDILATKYRKSTLTINKLKELFQIDEHITWPKEYLSLLHGDSQLDTQRTQFTVKQVLPNWMDISTTYCSKCKAYIPPGVKYTRIYHEKICFFCMEEVYHIIKESVDKFIDKSLISDIKTVRFIEQI